MTDYQLESITRITKNAQEIYNVSLRELFYSNKTKSSIARQMIWYATRQYLELSYQKQKDIWHKDRKVIWRGVKVIEGEISVNKERLEQFKRILINARD